MTNTATPLHSHNNRIIALIGMMGAGKTTVGRALAKTIGREFIDLDHTIINRCGVQIPTIFDIEGEAGFRKRETASLQEVLKQSNIILATGGGVILAEDNRILLKQSALVLYLKANTDELYRRIARDKKRPLLYTENPRQRLHDLVEQREPLYVSSSHYIIQSGNGSIHQVIKQIKELLTQEGIL